MIDRWRRTRQGVVCLAVAICFAAAIPASGAPLWGEVVSIRQPDGSLIDLRVWGDEFYSVGETMDGYTVVRDSRTGLLSYARLTDDGERLVSTGRSAGEPPPATGLTKHVRISKDAARAQARAAKEEFERVTSEGPFAPTGRLAARGPTTGTVAGITLIIDFSDDVGTITPTAIDNYCNLPGYGGYGNNGSVRDYFYDVSEGLLEYTNYVPTAYYRAANPKSYYTDPAASYGTRARQLITEALDALDSAGFDFSLYDADSNGTIDALNCYYAGGRWNSWGEGLWPHAGWMTWCADGVCTQRYQITNLGSGLTLGTFCHENGHMLMGWPDLYDYDGDSAGVGQFCLMCNSGPGTNPVEPNGYLKMIAGWADVTVVGSSQNGLTADVDGNEVYKFNHPTLSREYYLIENRQKSGRDNSIPDHGLAIWHIDTSGDNSDQQQTPSQHYLVTLVQADGDWDLENDRNQGDATDLFASPSYTDCTPDTDPSTDWWSGSPSYLYFGNISASGTVMTFDFADSPVPWTDVGTDIPSDTGDGMGAAWADHDGDGDIDLYVTNDGANRLFENDGDGTFTDATAGPLGDAGAGRTSVWGDYDNDGDPDLYIMNDGTANRLLRNDGGGVFVNVASGALADAQSGRDAAWADYDNDGDLDIYLSNGPSMSNRLLRNDGGGSFTDATPGPMINVGNSTGVVWGDYDGDGDPDLYVVTTAANRLFRNDGGGTFIDATSAPVNDPSDGRGAAWGDYDGDGDLDLYVTNASGAANKLFRNDGASFVDVTAGVLGDTGEGQGVAWGDYDNDSDLDLFVGNWGGTNRLLRNDGGGVFADEVDGSLAGTDQTVGVAWCDYDADGDLDIYVVNNGTSNYLNRNDGIHINHWLNVDLDGLVSNRDGIGAVVTAKAGPLTVRRQVGGNSGYGSGNSLDVELGLGASSVVDSLLIEWPSGVVNRYATVSADQSLLVPETLPPSTPVGVAIVAGPGEASTTISWSSVTEPQLDHYRIERDTSDAFGPGMIVFTTADTTYTDFPIFDTLERFYRVRAVSTGGSRSAPSDTVSSTPLQTVPPAPTGLALAPGDLVIDVSWNSVAAADLDHYRIERDTTALFGPGTVTYTTPDTTYVDSAVVTGRTYYYAIVAVDWVGLESVPSETVFTTSTDLAPGSPTRFKARSGANSVVMTWDANAEPDIDGYVVYRDTLPSFGPEDALALVTQDTYTDTTGALFEVYWYSVTAKDLGGNESAYSDTVGGVRAPGGAVFVDVNNTGVELGTFDNPYNSIQEGIDAASGGQAVVVSEGIYAGGVVLNKNLLVVGMSGASSTTILSGTSLAPVTAAAVNDSARLVGFTLDGNGTALVSLDCSSADVVVENCVLRGANTGAKTHTGSNPTFVGNMFLNNQTGLACEDSSRPHLIGNTFSTSALANVSSSGSPGPLVGGSLADANDFLDAGLFMVLNTGPATVDAEYNFWSDACVDSTWFLGAVDYSPWTDSLHVETYIECPETGIESGLPVRYALSPSFPNPFNPVTRIAYDVPSPGGTVGLRVYNATGRLVRTLVQRHVDAGRYSVEWNGTDESGAAVASGVYFYRLDAAGFSDSGKMVLLK